MPASTLTGSTEPFADDAPDRDLADQAFERALSQASVLVVDDEPGMCNFLKRALVPRCALVEVAASAEEAEALRLRYHFDLLLVDIRLPGLSGLDWLSRLRERGVRTPVIYMTAYADMQMSIQALRHGAGDFVIKPFRTDAMLQALHRALVRHRPVGLDELGRLKLARTAAEHGVIGRGKAIAETLRLVQRVASAPSTVLIHGETGTGKGLIARTVHALDRRPGEFVTLDCGSVPGERFESELFGQVRGAFAGAQNARPGLIAHAERGTLLLDEIGELPLSLQARLLRVLEERMMRPLGAEREQRVDVRVIATTNRDLGAMVRDGRFREDLWFRLNVLPIRVPPLRERLDDLPLLVEHFVQRLSVRLKRAPITLMHADHERLRSWRWPGNVRELRNTIERALLTGTLPPDSCLGEAHEASMPTGTEGFPLDWSLDAVERTHMRAVLASTGNNKSAAARVLGVSRKTLERKQQQWDQAAVREQDKDG